MSTARPNKTLPSIAPVLPATYWTPKLVDLRFVGYNSVVVQPNELNVITLMPPKIVVRITPWFSLWINGIPNTDIPDKIKLRAKNNKNLLDLY